MSLEICFLLSKTVIIVTQYLLGTNYMQETKGDMTRSLASKAYNKIEY